MNKTCFTGAIVKLTLFVNMHAKLNKDAQHNSTSHVKSLTAVALTYDEHAEFWLSLCSNADMEVHVRM